MILVEVLSLDFASLGYNGITPIYIFFPFILISLCVYFILTPPPIILKSGVVISRGSLQDFSLDQLLVIHYIPRIKRGMEKSH